MLGLVPKHFFEGKLVKFVIPTYSRPLPQKNKRKWSKILGRSHQPVKEKNTILPFASYLPKKTLGKKIKKKLG
jgi:hypothetical protein